MGYSNLAVIYKPVCGVARGERDNVIYYAHKIALLRS